MLISADIPMMRPCVPRPRRAHTPSEDGVDLLQQRPRNENAAERRKRLR